MSGDELRARYLALMRDELPAAARAGRWVVRADHCFGRILLDSTLGQCWYDVLDRRAPAYRQLTEPQLRQAIALGERVLDEGDGFLRELNRASLGYRGKLRAA